MTLDEIRDRATLTIAETSKLLGIGINQTYAAAKAGEIPSLKLGGTYKVPVPALLAMLGASEADDPAPALHLVGPAAGPDPPTTPAA